MKSDERMKDEAMMIKEKMDYLLLLREEDFALIDLSGGSSVPEKNDEDSLSDSD